MTVATIPVFSHVVIVAEENHGFGQIIGTSAAPYINNTLVAGGALFTNMHGLGHPSFPNYMTFFSGAVQGTFFGTGGDACPPAHQPYSAPNLGSLLLGAGKTFKGFAENLPANHSSCGPAPYAGRHVPSPWFSNIPASLTVDFAGFPTTAAGYAALPTVSFVSPNLNNDMHDGTVQQGDTWLQSHIDGYAQWAKTNNSLLIVWWDEDYAAGDNPPMVFYGANVVKGRYAESLTHYNVLRTLCDMYGLTRPGGAATATPITDVWSASGPPPPPAALVIDTATLPAQAPGVAFTVTLTAEGGTPPYKWANPAGLPAGVTVSPAGVLSGTAVAGGSYPFQASVTDSGSPAQTAHQPLTLVVTASPPPPPGLAITTPALPATVAGTAYRFQLAASGGTGTLTWTATAVPAGLTLTTAGLLSGTTTTAGNYSIPFSVRDTAGHTATATLVLAVSPPNTPPPPPPPPPASGAVALGAGVLSGLVPGDVMAPTLITTLGFTAAQDALAPGAPVNAALTDQNLSPLLDQGGGMISDQRGGL